jgi:hypothetical protein
VEGGGRVQFFDLTGGPVVRLAKERAMSEQAVHERAGMAAAREARRAALIAARPDVERLKAGATTGRYRPVFHQIPALGMFICAGASPMLYAWRGQRMVPAHRRGHESGFSLKRCVCCW